MASLNMKLEKNHCAYALEIVSIASTGRAASVWCVFFGWLSFERKLFQLSAVVVSFSLSPSFRIFLCFCFETSYGPIWFFALSN